MANAGSRSILVVGSGMSGITAAIEAAEVVKGLLQLEGRLVDSLLMVDLHHMQFLNVKVNRNKTCICK